VKPGLVLGIAVSLLVHATALLIPFSQPKRGPAVEEPPPVIELFLAHESPVSIQPGAASPLPALAAEESTSPSSPQPPKLEPRPAPPTVSKAARPADASPLIAATIFAVARRPGGGGMSTGGTGTFAAQTGGGLSSSTGAGGGAGYGSASDSGTGDGPLLDSGPSYGGKIEIHYPPLAARRGYEGTTVLLVQVLADGRAGKIDVLETSGYEILDSAAVDSVRRARFNPATRDGKPIVCRVRLPITFKLQEKNG
jgi:protein TonB